MIFSAIVLRSLAMAADSNSRGSFQQQRAEHVWSEWRFMLHCVLQTTLLLLFCHMSTLHIFNPSHDEALASPSPYYMPSKPARQLAVQWGSLPYWWAAEGDVVWQFTPEGKMAAPADFDWTLIRRIEPWGWDAHLRHQLQRVGAPSSLLPSDAALNTLRWLSHRQTTVQLVAAWREEVPISGCLLPESRLCYTMEETCAAMEKMGGAVMLKWPWSSSGRGVWPQQGQPNEKERTRIARCLQRQGSIEVQRRYERLGDGALEFTLLPTGALRYEGASVFGTAGGGTYSGNVVDCATQLEERFCTLWQKACPTVLGSIAEAQQQLRLVVERLKVLLSEALRPLRQHLAFFAPLPLGVDVLFSPSGLHPCVEINLRRTMGHAALCIGEQIAAQRATTLTAAEKNASLLPIFSSVQHNEQFCANSIVFQHAQLSLPADFLQVASLGRAFKKRCVAKDFKD